MLYPFRFHPVFKDYIWGGRNLSRFGKNLPESGRVAESWEISAHEQGQSILVNGPLAGATLSDLVCRLGQRLMGKGIPREFLERFPLLIKFIDAQDDLSIQVHPDDTYAKQFESGETGKNEMWYVMSAEPGAHLVAGVKPGVTKETFARAIEDGTCMDRLNTIPVHAGDVLNIPAGLVHAIGKGLIICEVQQNSDTTYRVFDYNRRDASGRTRPLHVQKALDVIDFSRSEPVLLIRGITQKVEEHTRRVLVLNAFFYVEEWHVNGIVHVGKDPDRFSVLTVLGGKGLLRFPDSSGQWYSEPLAIGDTLLLPAELEQ
jgi:mannose-6-phosphate isomerase